MDIYDIPKLLIEIKPYLELILEEAKGRYYSCEESYMNDQDSETIDKVNELLKKIEEITNELNG